MARGKFVPLRVRLPDRDFFLIVQLRPLFMRDLGLQRLVDRIQDVTQRDGRQRRRRMGITLGCNVVVQENWPSGDHVRGDYEPCSWRVRSRLGESLKRNRLPLGIYRSKLEERKVEIYRMGVGSKERVEFGGNDWRITIWVCRSKTGGRWYRRPWYHPRVGVRLLALVVGHNIRSLISVVERSPAAMGVISRNGQRGCAQEGSRHPRVPGRTSGTSARGSPRIFIQDPGSPDGRVGSGRVGEVNGGYVRRDSLSVVELVEVWTGP